ncbi:MAG TPA: branched-chain amino acid ABC transporter permease [Nitrospiraceae bacterium]|nr:branched-chain amino acid ABC transporter permease [Nitrospiraceae bacterium]
MGIEQSAITALMKSAISGGIIFCGIILFEGIKMFLTASGGIAVSNNIKGGLQSVHNIFKKAILNKGLLLVLLILLIFVPFALNNYYIDILTITGIYAILALGLNIVVGLAGLLDLGYIAFYAIGAYSYGILNTEFGIPFWPALLIGGLLAAFAGMFLGMITLRLRGDYLAIVTLGFLMIVHLILNNWDSLTHGPNGILGISSPSIGKFVFSEPIHFYYLILAISILAIFIINRINNSRIGRAWIAIREDEIAASAMGINVTTMKILAITLGASWAGVAGVFFAGRYSFISPESFTFLETVIVLSMVVLGGMGSIPGVILGAALLIILPEVLRGFQDYRMLVFGGAMVLMMVFRPQGLIGNPRRKIELMPVNRE